jgi:hypothetical protein
VNPKEKFDDPRNQEMFDEIPSFQQYVYIKDETQHQVQRADIIRVQTHILLPLQRSLGGFS